MKINERKKMNERINERKRKKEYLLLLLLLTTRYNVLQATVICEVRFIPESDRIVIYLIFLFGLVISDPAFPAENVLGLECRKKERKKKKS